MIPTDPSGRPVPTAALLPVSMYAIAPPEPKSFKKHDLITIIIDESSLSQSSQTLETERESDANARLNAIVDPIELLNLRLRTGNTRNIDLLNFNASREFSGEGDYERRDRMSARITAQVIDVKPNGSLVLEARKRLARDEEISLLVVAGVCRSEDITSANTILSSQIAGLTIIQQNEGDLRSAAQKGRFTRALDMLFDF